MAVQVVVAFAVLMAAIGFLLLIASLVRGRGAVSGPSGSRVVSTRAPVEAGAAPAPPRVAGYVPESQEVQVNRRMFLNRAWLLAFSVFGVGFGTTSLGFLWPPLTGGFGGKVRLEKRLQDIIAQIRNDKRPFYSPEGRFYIVLYDTSDRNNPYVKAGVAKQGIMALFQKCAHLGCRVPFCESAQWFECPCHGSKYNVAGEIQSGPAPAGLWRFQVEIEEGGVIVVDTSLATAQPAKGADTVKQPPAGSHCV